jgi:prepilin-type N-terminal cleavage/methylation domain-containing protein
MISERLFPLVYGKAVNRNRQGFALVELAVAIGIVVTLSAGYATPALGQRRESTRTDSRSVITTAEIQLS